MTAPPMGRSAGPGEIPPMVAVLASDRASYIGGAIVTIDRGLGLDSAVGVER